MRYTILFLLLFPISLLAQPADQGAVTYEQVIEIKIDMSKIPEGMGDMAKLIPKEQRFMKQLHFTSNASLYEAVEEDESEEIVAEGPGKHMRMRMERADDKCYTDLKKGRQVESREFFGRTFLIQDEPEKLAWKMTGEVKEILGYPCMKATAVKDSVPIEAWFTTSIPVSTGPESMGGQLPGLVLEATVENARRGGNVIYTAKSVDLRKVSKSEMQEPKKGKAVTREEYEEIVMAKIKEMQEQFGGKNGRGGRRMMIAH